MSETVLSLACIAALIALWRITASIERTAVGPVGVFVGIWVFGAGLPLVVWTVGSADDLVRVSAYGLILLFGLAGVLAAALARRAVPRTWVRRTLTPKQSEAMRVGIWVTLVIGISHPLTLAYCAVADLGAQSVLGVPAAIASARYGNTWQPPIYLSFVRIFVFTCTSLCGFAFADLEFRRRYRLTPLIWIAPAVLSFYVEASRMALIYPTIYAIGAFCAGAAYFGTAAHVTIRTVTIRALAVAVLAIPLVHIGYTFRFGDKGDLDTSLGTINRTVATAFGHMPALGYWIDEGAASGGERSVGLYTLSGITGMLGGPERPQGLYLESVTIEAEGLDASESNVYTALRVLSEDFGFIGALAVFTVATFLAVLSWGALAKGRIGGFCLAAASFTFSLLSPVTFLFVYNSAIGAVALSSLVLAAVCQGGATVCPEPEEAPTP